MDDKKTPEERMKEKWGRSAILDSGSKNQSDISQSTINPVLSALHQRHIDNCLRDCFAVLRETTIEYAAKFWITQPFYDREADTHEAIAQRHSFLFAPSLYHLRQAEAKTTIRNTIDIHGQFNHIDMRDLASPDFRRNAQELLSARYDAREHISEQIRMLSTTNIDRCTESAEEWSANSTHMVLAVLNQDWRNGKNLFLINTAKQSALYAINAPDKALVMEQGLKTRAHQFVMQMPHIRNIGRFIALINERAKTMPAPILTQDQAPDIADIKGAAKATRQSAKGQNNKSTNNTSATVIPLFGRNFDHD